MQVKSEIHPPIIEGYGFLNRRKMNALVLLVSEPLYPTFHFLWKFPSSSRVQPLVMEPHAAVVAS